MADPALAQFFMTGVPNFARVAVNEYSALGISAVWRSISVISGTLASLPLRSLRETDGRTQKTDSFLDNPGGPGPDALTPFEWKEQVFTHLLIHGNAYLAHVFNGAGAIVGLVPFHPLAVCPEWEYAEDGKLTGRKLYRVSQLDGRLVTFDSSQMTQVMGLSLDGLRGLSIITIARSSLGTAIAGDQAAANLFGNGPLIAGMVTPEDDITEDDAKAIKADLQAKITGTENAGTIAVINRKLKFTQWQTSNADAQFLESRQYSVEDVSRWWGVPLHMLARSGAVSNWGTGIEEQNVGLGRTVLSPWAQRLDQRLSRLLPRTQWAEFDFAGLERANPEDEIRLLLEQISGGLLTVNEARAIRNLPPLAATAPPAPEVPA